MYHNKIIVVNMIGGAFLEHNKDIRREAAVAGLKLWQIAAGLGLSDGGFSRKLRFELSDEEKARVRAVIAELQERNDNAN